MRSDAFECVWRHLDASGNFEIFGDFSADFDDFWIFWTLGANNYAEIRVQGLTISGANYSEPPLVF